MKKTLIQKRCVAWHLSALCLLGFVSGVTDVGAATYYVTTTGNNSNNGSQQSPWRNVAYAASRVVAGDVVRVQAGSYSGVVTHRTDGTAASPITYVADGAVTLTSGVILNGSDYVRLIGFTIDMNFSGEANGIQIISATGCEVWNCTIRRHLNRGIYLNQSSGNVIIGNTFVGTYGTAGSSGESTHIVLFGNDNLVAFNTYYKCNEDYNYFNGQRNRWVNNYAYEPNPASGAHVDFIQTDSGNATIDTVLEANFYVDSGSLQSDHHVSNLQNSGADFTYLLSRRNIWHNIGTGTHGIFQNWANVYFVNDSYLEAQRHSSQAGNRQGLYTSSSVENPRIFNSIFVETWGTGVTGPQVFEADGSGFQHGYNLAWDLQGGSPAWSGPFASETGKVTANPAFANYTADDFRLTTGSPAIGAAGALTKVSSANGTGTSFSVADAGFFRGDDTAISQYGGNLVVGDKITVGTTPLTINSINGNTITVSSSFTWSNGDAVYYGWGTTPDIGAYPANHVPLTAATYVQNGNDFVVTPNGDTRFVVFLVDGIPTIVDNSSPYTATIPSGTVTMRAYPLYASKTPFVIATGDSQPRPLPASNLRTQPAP